MLMPGSRTAVSVIACAAIAAAVPFAFAADTTIKGGKANGDNVFSPTSYTIGQGDTATLSHVGGSSHNVTANSKGPGGTLFLSKTIRAGSARVKGVEYLNTGSYPFRCTIHFGMDGTLNVNSSGTPVARPNFKLTVLTRSIRAARNRGKLVVRVRGIAAAAGVKLVAKRGKRVLGSKPGVTVAAGQTRKIVIRLTKRGRAQLTGKRTRIKVIGSVPFGKSHTAARLLS